MANSPPSQDAIASLITQVSPTGQPARAPSRPVRPRQGQSQTTTTTTTKKKSATKPKDTTTAGTVSSTSATGVNQDASTKAAGTTDNTPTVRGDSTFGTEETAVANSGSDAVNKPLSTASPVMHPASTSSTTTPPSTGQSTKQRPSSQDLTSSSPKLASQQAQPTTGTTAAKPRQLQKVSSPNNKAGPSSSSTSLQHKKKAKRKSWVSSLFSSCFTGGSAHSDDDEERGGQQGTSSGSGAVMTERKAGTANATTRGTTAANTTASTSTSPTTTDNAKKDVNMVNFAKEDADRNESSASKLGHPTESTSGTGTTLTNSRDLSSSSQLPDNNMARTTPSTGSALLLPLSASAASGLGASGSALPKSEIAPEILAANQAGGTPLSRDETGDVLSGAVQAPGSEGLTPKKEKRRKSSHGEGASGTGDISRVSSLNESSSGNDESEAVEDSEAGDEEEEEEEEEEEYVDEEERIIAAGGMGIPLDEEGNPAPLLKELTPVYKGKKCLVLDLDETLVHSSFKLIHSPDFVVPVEIENTVHNVYVIKRPGVDAFMKRMGELYEVVVFTASLSKYADPVLDQLDIHRVVEHRLFRESCYNHRGNYVKDLSQLGREIGDTIIIDNSPASYIFHPNNAVPVSSWFNDPHDTELTDLQGFLADLAEVPDVRGVLDGGLFPVQ